MATSSDSRTMATEETPLELTSPGYEYIQILRSYLTEAQRREVQGKVETHFQVHGHGADDDETLAYAELLQGYLTADQKADAVERLELVYRQRGLHVPARVSSRLRRTPPLS